ncbi:MAG: serine/threonine-protein kinase [Halieaceae bacterium]
MLSSEIGPYRVLRLIKRGGGGSVYVAFDQRLRRRVALKFIPLPSESQQRSALIDECRKLAAHNHRFIVQLYDVVELPDSVILVMEYVAGNDLEDLLGHASLDAGAVVELAVDLCAALAACHAAGILHRDLKPANILIDCAGHIKLSDFGIAEDLKDGAPGLASPGSPGFASPEQIDGAALDERSDLYSLGVLLDRLLVGEPAPGLPASLLELIDSLLQQQRERRPSSALKVRQQLLAIAREGLLAHDVPLAQIVSAHRRAEDLVDDTVDLPVASTDGARSLFTGNDAWWSSGQSGRWYLPRLLALPLLVCLLAVLLYGAVVTDEQTARQVIIEPTQFVGVDPSVTPGVERLQILLQQALQKYPELRLLPSVSPSTVDSSAPDNSAQRLLLQVRCNTYVCSTRLALDDGVETVSDSRALLPSMPESVWQERLDQGLRVVLGQ